MIFEGDLVIWLIFDELIYRKIIENFQESEYLTTGSAMYLRGMFPHLLREMKWRWRRWEVYQPIRHLSYFPILPGAGRRGLGVQLVTRALQLTYFAHCITRHRCKRVGNQPS